ncbi:MAG: 2-oxo acid dehydrogenase subunit E2 [Clostridiales bacterium]|nr:2-oxo acid dehydrogenase subunit E2 [Clostridiales bacterium]
MAIAVIMPRQGQSVESCIITSWKKNVGDTVNVGDILFSYETDKAAFDEEAKDAGTMLARFFEEGDDVACLTNVCVIGNPGESFAEFDPNGGAAAAAPAAEAAAPAAEAASDEETVVIEATGSVADGLKISPRAKAMAEATGADLSKVVPTGPDGRVIARDVQRLLDEGLRVSPAAKGAYAGGVAGSGMGGMVTLNDLNKKEEPAQAAAPAAQAAAPAESDTYIEPMTNIRKVIAKSMQASLNNMAQLTHNMSFDCTEIQKLRKMFKDKGADRGMDKITLNDILLFAVSRTLMKPEHRALNANLLENNQMKYYRHVNLGVAIDTERGLMVPTIFKADTMSLKEISIAAKELANDCKAGKINPDLLRDGSFTVSNLGSFGVETFTPVINPPQTGILGVNTIVNRVREVNGQLQMYPAMSLSLTYDHRALDGAPASRFLRDLCKNLENINLLLAE